MKMKFKAMSGTSRDLLAGYLDEHLWRQYNGRKTLRAFDNLMNKFLNVILLMMVDNILVFVNILVFDIL